MALFDDTENTTIDTAVTNSGNTVTTNNANYGVDLDNVGNDNHSVNDSGNQAWAVDDSFKENFDNSYEHTSGSYNSDIDTTTVSFIDESVTNVSTSAGDRSYDTGFSGSAGLGGVTGDAMINNQNSIVDQSVNQNIASGGGVFQHFGTDSVVASGTGAMAAGGDIDISQEVDRSTTITSGGDILLDGSSKIENTTVGSYNESNETINISDESVHTNFDNVENDYSATLNIDSSFNETDTSVDYDDWNIDADVVWDSNNVVVGDVDIDG